MGSAIHKARSRRQVCWLFASRLLQSESSGPSMRTDSHPDHSHHSSAPAAWASASLSPSSLTAAAAAATSPTSPASTSMYADHGEGRDEVMGR